MRRFLLSTLCVLCSFASVLAQEWSLTLNASDGLPGVEKYYEYNPYYEYTSPLFTPGVAVDKVRITVVNTMSDEAPNGNNVVFALSGLEVTDGDGNKVGYTAYSNADHNTLAWQEDGDGLPALSDDDLKSYFHSMWLGNYPVADYHYVELELDNTISSFSLKWTTRLDGYSPGKNAPTVVGITLGSEYIPESVGSEFVLGDAVTMESELAAQNRLFVLRSNAIKSFTTSSGITYYGSGPLYMRYAEEGDVVASTVNVMQLIPAGDGRYLVYWPLSGKYLANSAGVFNGLNGWQFSTGKPKEAALVKFTAVADGKFEMQYDGANSSGDLSLYVGAELRDGVDSKMKTFDLFHKQALENGDYTQGFSLPVAFGWSVYEAVLDEATVNELMLSLSTIATTILQPVSDNAAMYLSRYGDHNGYCTNNENILLGDAISNAKNKMNDADNVSEILNAEIAITEALSHYMAAGLGEYDARVKELYSTSTFSSYPYTPGTYPEDSKSILESLSSMIASAKSAAGTYTPAQYEQIFNQLESEIGLFLSTKVEESVTPDGGDGGDDGDSDIELVEGEVVYVYLCDGGVDAYQLASLDGEYYEQDGKLFFPIKDGDFVYYTRSEYDSCSMVAPQLPTMTSFKFNNKYNPNLNVDVEAETIDTEMMLRVNSIGKWLTASFQLSDDKAVAYVDTVLQESKVTRHSFARDVTYKVTYPGYNIVQRVKVQDEIWSEGTNAVEVAEVALTEEMLATNKPSVYSNEGLGSLLDNNASTNFHSTWGSANDNTVKVATYITIDLPEALDKIQLYYRCRTDAYGYNPKVWEIYASNTGDDWTLVRTLDYTADNMPVGGLGQEYQSPTIDLGGSYSKLKILQTEGEYSKNHFVLSELRLYKVVEGEAKEPEKIKDAIYENRNVPFGREYKVKVEWPTDNAVSVPRIDIDIEGGQTVTSKKYYLNAKFRITGYGVYDNFEDSVQIKGRGNSSWGGTYSKNPYRLKFDEKVKPFGLTKGKSWVLLANKQSGSLMANAIAMKIGQMAGAAYTNHIIPVDLYINGEYRGNYMFTEKVGLANNSVDIDEALGYMLELDTNTDADEPIVRIGTYNLPMKVAEPDLDELTDSLAIVRKSRMMTDLRALSDAVAIGSDIEQHLDIEAAARFYLACDLALNQEICHPKSFFLFKDESAPDGKLTFGPIWDFDWAFGYEGSSSYCSNGATSSVIAQGMEIPEFWQDLTAYEEFKKNYYKVWKEFIDKNSMAELNDYIDSYYSFSKSSFDRNSYKWGDNFDEVDKTRAKQWLETRKNFIFSTLDVYDLDDLLTTLAGDVNCNNQITIHDAALIAAYLANDIHKDFREQKADYDNDGSVTLADAEGVAELVIESDVPSPAYWYSTPMAMGELYANDFELEIGSEVNVPLSISAYSTEPYNALQFDLEVPDGVFVNDIVPGEELDGCKFSYAQLGLNTYRVVMYAEDNVPFTTGDDVVVNMNIMTFDVIEESLRKLNISNVYAVNGDNNEVRMNNVAIAFSESTGIDATLATIAVTGGDCITVTALEAQEVNVYSVDGRLVRSVKVNAGTTRIALPAGLYIVNGEKVLVK